MINPTPNVVYHSGGRFDHNNKGIEFLEDLRAQIASEMKTDPESLKMQRQGQKIIITQLLPFYVSFCVTISDYPIALKLALVTLVLLLAKGFRRLL